MVVTPSVVMPSSLYHGGPLYSKQRPRLVVEKKPPPDTPLIFFILGDDSHSKLLSMIELDINNVNSTPTITVDGNDRTLSIILDNIDNVISYSRYLREWAVPSPNTMEYSTMFTFSTAVSIVQHTGDIYSSDPNVRAMSITKIQYLTDIVAKSYSYDAINRNVEIVMGYGGYQYHNSSYLSEYVRGNDFYKKYVDNVLNNTMEIKIEQYNMTTIRIGENCAQNVSNL